MKVGNTLVRTDLNIVKLTKDDLDKMFGRKNREKRENKKVKLTRKNRYVKT